MPPITGSPLAHFGPPLESTQNAFGYRDTPDVQSALDGAKSPLTFSEQAGLYAPKTSLIKS